MILLLCPPHVRSYAEHRLFQGEYSCISQQGVYKKLFRSLQ